MFKCSFTLISYSSLNIDIAQFIIHPDVDVGSSDIFKSITSLLNFTNRKNSTQWKSVICSNRKKHNRR